MTAEQNAPLNDYLGPVLAYKKLIAIVAVGAIALGVAAGMAIPASYSATTSILVYPISADPTKALGTDDSSIDMPTELRIATSQAVIDDASALMAGQTERIGPKTLADSVTASSPKESSILDITVDAPTGAKAKAGADAVATAYLEFRAELANNNKLAAEASTNSRLAILNGRLAEVAGQLDRATEGSAEQVILAVESNSIKSEVAAQQAALADLSTLTIDATKVIDVAVQPEAPAGLGLLQILVGSIAGGLVLGVIAAYAAAAVRAPGGASNGSTADDRPKQTSGSDDLETGGLEARDLETPALATSDLSVAAPVMAAAELESGSDAAAEIAKSAVAQFEEATEADLVTETVAGTGTDTDTEDGTDADAGTDTEVEIGLVTTLQSVSDADDERRETYTVQPAEEERRALHIDGTSQTALTATPDMDSLLEHLQELGKVGPIVGLTLGEEGVGTSIAVAFDLADALQSLGAKVLMIDASYDDALLASLLSVDAAPGLAEVLTGETTLRSAVRQVGGLKGLDALTVGEVTDSTVDAINGSAFERLLAEAKVDYHSILIIAGAVSDTTTVPTLAALADGLIVGTTQKPGEQAGAELCTQLAALPAPTLEFLSEMLVVERADGAMVVGAASM
ncbi:MAG: hypothetical protein ACRBK7_06915 [Acidimicrobiales bacterium]